MPRVAGWGMAGLGAVLLAGALLGVAAQTTLWDRDEPRFAEATVAMVRSDNYLYPTFSGALRPDKPVLIYWLMSIPVRLFGAGELAVRSVAAVGMAIAERFLAEHFNRPDHTIVDHRVWAFASDGDLMEGVASEAASLAAPSIMQPSPAWAYTSKSKRVCPPRL